MSNRRTARQVLPFVLVASGMILLLGAGLYLLNPLGMEGSRLSNTPTAVVGQRIPYPEVPRISLGDAKAAYDTRQAVFVDVRDSESYSAGHIPGALNIPLADLASRQSELNKTAWIITYCT